MGAFFSSDGVTFRVWASHADRVFVTGEFNQWSETAHPLAREERGYWSAEISGVQKGDRYKYLIVNGSQKLYKVDPYAREVTSSIGDAILLDHDFDWGETGYRMPAWHQLVIYEMHVGTFRDEPGGPPGDLQSAAERLPYLQDLGINAVQIMPLAEFPGGFSWGYNPSHPFAVEQDYGGATALKEFVRTAHDHGIAVILDVVYNHFGPSDLDLWQFDGWSENGKGGIYFYNDWRAQTPWGETRPDYGRGEVRQYIRDNALMWLHEYRLDGLRWDATAWIRSVHGAGTGGDELPEGWSLMQWVNSEIQSQQPWKITIAEDMRDNYWLTIKPDSGGAGFGAQWDAGFVHPIRQAIISPDDASRDMGTVQAAIEHRFGEDVFKRVIYTESHDEIANGKARVPEAVWPGNVDSWFSKKRSVLGAALVLTAPGIPMLFQGQELLEDRWFHDQDPIDWSRLEQYGGLVELYRDLIRLRRNWHDTTRGLSGQHVHVYHVNHEAKVLAMHRWDQGGPGDSVVVVVNMTNRSHAHYVVGFPRRGLWRVRFNSDWEGYDPSFGNHFAYDTEAHPVAWDGLPYSGPIGIGPYSVVILSQEE